ncbi:hypothetical protein QOZ80_7AG0553740 [Eleusine coracana subsp. coracana]|nr:hypothetical protein QOZ80_7AG0553740 [Eleusine coracana subsp. coracana]
MAAPADVLIEALIEEILIRFPPDDPASLVRAALVCKPWCRIVAGAGFRRRFREFHRTAPVLGLLCNYEDKGFYREAALRFIQFPTASFPHTHVRRNRRAIDARHGRVLLRTMFWDSDDLLPANFVVWNPVSCEEQQLPSLPWYPDRWNAAVLCAATPSASCDHLDCSGGPFLVVAVETGANDVFISVYSSEAGEWSEQSIQHPGKSDAHWSWPSVLVGTELCFMLQPRTGILKYNLRTREISVINLPSVQYKPDVLTTTYDGRLGFATVHESRLYLWSREDGPSDNAGWTESRVIQLDSLLPSNALLTSPTAVGFAAGVGIVFMWTDIGVFSIDLKSQRVTKIHKCGGQNILPYMNFYTPVSRFA